MTGPKQDPRWRRAERIRERVLELLEVDRRDCAKYDLPEGHPAAILQGAMFDLFPGIPPTLAETSRALGVLRRADRVRYDRSCGLWRLA